MNKLDLLKVPFDPSAITFKPGATTRDKSKALGLAYASLRAYQDRLDEVFGCGWDVSYMPWGADRIVATIVVMDGDICVSRSSTGEVTAEAGKREIAGAVAEAQAFKRACAMLGLGRYLYDLPQVWAEFDAEKKRFTPTGEARLRRSMLDHLNSPGRQWPDVPPEVPEGVDPRDQTPKVDVEVGVDPETEVEVDDGILPPGQAGVLVKWTREMQRKGGQVASEPQVKLLTNKLYYAGGKTVPGATLLRCLVGDGQDITKELASKLIDALTEFKKNDDTGKYDVPNPKYNPVAYEAIVQLVAFVAGG